MDYKIIPVALDQVNTGDHTFKITTNSEINELALSVSAIGLLQPPVLQKKAGGFIVICGFRRIAACKTRNLARIPVRIIAANCPALMCAQIAIADNAHQRPLNIVEQSRAFHLIEKFAGGSPDWLKIAESTGLSGSQTAVDRIMPVASMPVALQGAILEGSIALPIALRINQFEKDDAAALCFFFQRVGAGLNIQREMFESIIEISFRDDIPVNTLLTRSEISDIVRHSDLSAPQKAQQLRTMLKVQRYPEISNAHASYNQKVKTLKLSPRIQIHPPRHFEGKTYRLSLKIDSRRQLKALQPELEKLVQHPSLLPE